jgi:hypothetical protein
VAEVTPAVLITEYTVLALPAESVNRWDWAIKVERRSADGDLWAVTRGGVFAFDEDGNMAPDSRGTGVDRFPLEKALALAQRVAITHRVNGKTAAEVWAWEQAQRAARAPEETK